MASNKPVFYILKENALRSFYTQYASNVQRVLVSSTWTPLQGSPPSPLHTRMSAVILFTAHKMEL